MRDLEPMSRTGYSRLMEELTQLETVELPEVQRTVAEAREEGDLKENAAYIYGRQRQGHIVGRIGELKGLLNRADIVDSLPEHQFFNFTFYVIREFITRARKDLYPVIEIGIM